MLALILLCSVCFPEVVRAESITYFVTNKINTSAVVCNGYRSCHTLNELAINSSLLFLEYANYSLVLEGGIHKLTVGLVVSDIDQLEISSFDSEIDITYGNVTVYNVSSFSINNFQLFASEHQNKPSFFISKTRKAVKFDNVNISNVGISAILNGGPRRLNSVFVIRNSSVENSALRFELKNCLLLLLDSYFYGNVLFVETTLSVDIVSKEKMIRIVGCRISGRTSLRVQADSDILLSIVDISDTVISDTNYMQVGGGIHLERLVVYIVMYSRVQLNIMESNISSLCVEVSEESSLFMNVSKCFHRPIIKMYGIEIKQMKFSRLLLDVRDSVFEHSSIGVSIQAIKYTSTSLKLHDTRFVYCQALSIFSSGRFLYVYLFNVTISGSFDQNAVTIQAAASESSVELVKCSFLYNFGNRGACVYFLSNPQSSLTLNKVFFYENVDLTSDPAIVLVINCDNVTIHNSLFEWNTGTPVEIVKGQLYLSGFTSFRSNIATNGGGLSLICSTVIFEKGLVATFASNKALNVGGAIYVAPCFDHDRIAKRNNYKFISTVTVCFFQISIGSEWEKLSLRFLNNSALNGGEDIFGTSVHKHCIAQKHTQLILTHFNLQQLFKIRNSKNTSLSSVASDPKRVCVCDDFGEPQCSSLDFIYNIKILYPGEMFTVSLVVVGNDFGTVTATTKAGLLGSTFGSLGDGQQTRLAFFRHCTSIQYSVHSSRPTETIVFTASGSKPLAATRRSKLEDRLKVEHQLNKDSVFVYLHTEEIQVQLLTTPVYFNVTLANCPLGFELIGDPPSCQCQKELVQNNIKHCIIVNHTGFVYRRGSTWVNATFNGNISVPIVYKSCPYDYCLSENTSVDLRYPDAQCALGHSATLCGACSENLSLALGTNRCLDCSNTGHLVLLIFFIAAGFVLVIFIKALDFTVSKGTINGLIFYANIVWAEKSILFSKQTTAHSVMSVFIAWLNLDFGIETCFADGLTGYQKAWLQFLFPVYVWCIAGVIIISCRYSTMATNLFGNNSVPVLLS